MKLGSDIFPVRTHSYYLACQTRFHVKSPVTMPPEMAKFAKIRSEIQRMLVNVQLAQGEDKLLLLRHVDRLITSAFEAISTDKRNPLSANPATRKDLANLRDLVNILIDAGELNRRT